VMNVSFVLYTGTSVLELRLSVWGVVMAFVRFSCCLYSQLHGDFWVVLHFLVLSFIIEDKLSIL
jgi:hypothetical protein